MSEEPNTDKPRPARLADADSKPDSQHRKLASGKAEEKVRIHPILKERRLEKLDAASTRC